MEDITKYLDRILELTKQGFAQEAILLYEKLLDAFPENVEYILMEKAKLEFRNMLLKDALIDFMQAYAVNSNNEIYDLILEAYLKPNLLELQNQYDTNLQRLKEYPFYWNDFDTEELDIFVLWADEEILCMVNTTGKTFGIFPRKANNEQKSREDISFMVINSLWSDCLLYYLEQTKILQPSFDQENPFYLVYDRNVWMLFNQITDISILLNNERTVFLVGEKCFENYFKDTFAIYPQIIMDEMESIHYEVLLQNVNNKKIQEYQERKTQIALYYNKHKTDIIQNIQSKRLRILFYTCRFTTALQYHTRDCMQAAQRMGWETKLLIEPDGLHSITLYTCQEYINDFKPDIIFCIDHFRDERGIPENIIWVTWIQDCLPQSTGNKDKVNSLGARDILASMYISDLAGRQWGMQYKDTLKMPISVNRNIYHNWMLSKAELESYECDICIVANASDYANEINCYLQSVASELKNEYEDVIKVYIDLMEQELFFYGFGQNLGIIQYIVHELKFDWEAESVQNLSTYLYKRIFYMRYKALIAEWLIENGYTNLKLYGNDWENNPICKPYAMGVIENGEKLSKALSAAKIAIGLHPHVSFPARLIETIASGTFYLAHNIPEEIDQANAREYFKENEEIVFYYNKKDLLEKIEYFLNNSEQREKIVKAGQERIEKELTYEAVLDRVMKEAAELVIEREG